MDLYNGSGTGSGAAKTWTGQDVGTAMPQHCPRECSIRDAEQRGRVARGLTGSQAVKRKTHRCLPQASCPFSRNTAWLPQDWASSLSSVLSQHTAGTRVALHRSTSKVTSGEKLSYRLQGSFANLAHAHQGGVRAYGNYDSAEENKSAGGWCSGYTTGRDSHPLPVAFVQSCHGSRFQLATHTHPARPLQSYVFTSTESSI